MTNWQVLQTRRFARVYKKLSKQLEIEVNAAVADIVANPYIGEQNKGDLAALRVYKFHANKQLFLLGYTVDEVPKLIYLESVGAHENLYRDIKR